MANIRTCELGYQRNDFAIGTIDLLLGLCHHLAKFPGALTRILLTLVLAVCFSFLPFFLQQGFVDGQLQVLVVERLGDVIVNVALVVGSNSISQVESTGACIV